MSAMVRIGSQSQRLKLLDILKFTLDLFSLFCDKRVKI